MKRLLLLFAFAAAAFAQPIPQITPTLSVPVTCQPVQLWVITNTGALYSCANGVPTLVSGSGGGVQVDVGGVTIGTQPAINFIAGTGLLQSCTNNVGSSRIDCTPSINSAVALTIATAQSGAPWFCNSANGTTNYICSLSAAAALTAYTPGMWLLLVTDTTNTSASPTLNVDTLGQKTITMADGATVPPAGTIVAGSPYWIEFDGTEWRLQQPPNIAYPGSISAGAGGGVSGLITCGAGTAHTAIAAGRFGFGCPATLTNPLELDPPNAQPTANQLMLFGAVSSNVSLWSWLTFDDNGIGGVEFGTGAGTANAQTVTLSPAITALVAGTTRVMWLPAAANTTTTPTLAVSGLTAKTITKCGHTALAASDLTTTALAYALYDGTDFQLQNPQAAGCGSSGGGTEYQTAQQQGTGLTQRPTFNLRYGLNATDNTTNTATYLDNIISIDSRQVSVVDNFLKSSTTSGQIGNLGWSTSTIVAACGTATNTAAGAWPEIGVKVGIVTGGTSTDGCQLSISGSTIPLTALYNNTTSFWVIGGRFALNGTTNTEAYIGLMSAVGAATPTNFAGVRYDTTLSDTTFEQCLYNSTTSTTCTAGPAVDTAFHTIFVLSDQAMNELQVPGSSSASSTNLKVWIVIDGGTPVSFCASGCTVTVTPQTNTLQWVYSIDTQTGSAETLYVDRFWFLARTNTTYPF